MCPSSSTALLMRLIALVALLGLFSSAHPNLLFALTCAIPPQIVLNPDSNATLASNYFGF